jgi:septation ring formation regulator EzrA
MLELLSSMLCDFIADAVLHNLKEWFAANWWALPAFVVVTATLYVITIILRRRNSETSRRQTVDLMRDEIVSLKRDLLDQGTRNQQDLLTRLNKFTLDGRHYCEIGALFSEPITIIKRNLERICRYTELAADGLDLEATRIVVSAQNEHLSNIEKALSEMEAMLHKLTGNEQL